METPIAGLAVHSDGCSARTPRACGCEDDHGQKYWVTANDVRIAGELGALLDKEFLAQDLPKCPPNEETAPESLTEAVQNLIFLGCGGLT